jgi:hypothetical protein
MIPPPEVEYMSRESIECYADISFFAGMIHHDEDETHSIEDLLELSSRTAKVVTDIIMQNNIKVTRDTIEDVLDGLVNLVLNNFDIED